MLSLFIRVNMILRNERIGVLVTVEVAFIAGCSGFQELQGYFIRLNEQAAWAHSVVDGSSVRWGVETDTRDGTCRKSDGL